MIKTMKWFPKIHSFRSSVNRNVCKVDCYAENSNSGSNLATYIASNAELLTEQIIQILMRWSLQKLFIGGFTDEEGEVFTNKYLTAGVRQWKNPNESDEREILWKLNMEYQKERNHDKWHPCTHLIKKMGSIMYIIVQEKMSINGLCNTLRINRSLNCNMCGI